MNMETEDFLADELEQSEEELLKESEELLEIRWITKDNAVFARTSGGFVSLDFNGQHWPRIAIHRAFPFSDPDRWISIREPDRKAKEIGIIKEMKELPKDTRDMLQEQLALRYFTPVITQIVDIKEEYGFAYFDVITDHGACRFTSRTGGDAIVRLTDTRLMISDLDGNRFEIPDINRFSTAELKKLDLFI